MDSLSTIVRLLSVATNVLFVVVTAVGRRGLKGRSW